MTTNPLLAIIAPALIQALNDAKAASDAVAANPTIENANEQLAKLELEALNPTHFTGVSLAGAAQEVSNLLASFEAHISTLVAAPTAASVPTEVAAVKAS